jgi:predicted O-linked N-acetylglucosamine transferase (SPINDLY family)
MQNQFEGRGGDGKEAEARVRRALHVHQQGQFEVAREIYEGVLKDHPGHFDALFLLGTLSAQTGRYQDAVNLLDLAIAIDPNAAQTWNNRGNALQELKRPQEALDSFDRAVALQPEYVEAWNNRGNALKDLRRLEQALASYDHALLLRPDFAEAHMNRGNVLRNLRCPGEALRSYERALRLKPHYAEAHLNHGNAMKDLQRLDEALVSYGRALRARPDYAEAFGNRGNILAEMKRMQEALASYNEAMTLDPQCQGAAEGLLYTRMKICDWSGFTASLTRLEQAIQTAKRVISPFPLLALLDCPDLHRRAASEFVQANFPRVHPYIAPTTRTTSENIRIGYFSSDFRNHAVGRLMVELLEAHDKSRFEIFGISFGSGTADDVQLRVAAACDRYFDVRDKSDHEIARACRAAGIDIAIDLNGHTKDARTGIFAQGCAPIQVNYLGYPGTMGADYFDYIIADATVIPKDQQIFYTEKVVYLPNSYLINHSGRRVPQRAFTRQEFGLPESGFVFCCFNNNYKITPSTFKAWMAILQAVPGSVLWLFEDNAAVAKNLRREAGTQGIEDHRLVFAGFMPSHDEHLGRYTLADLFLDTSPYNAHATATDALWAGLPVLTRVGRSFAGRVAASVLKALDLPELVVQTDAAYQDKAVDLARDTTGLAAIRSRLARNRNSCALFDAQAFARHIECAYSAMYTRHRAGRAPECIEICG